MNTNKHLLKTYTADSGRRFKQTTMVNHKGTVVALAMDNQRQIYYTVLNLADTQETSPLDVNYWLDNPLPLEFAEEIVQVGYGIADPTLMPLVKKGSQEEVKSGMLREEEKDTILSSTARLTADAPFQALSDGQYIYIFRQSLGQLGQLSAAVNGTTTSLPLESGLTRNLPRGSLLQVGLTMTEVRVSQDTSSGAMSIPIESVTLNVNRGTPIFDGPMVFAMQRGGASAKEYIEIGRLEQDISNNSQTTTLTLKEGVSHSLPDRAILRIGNTSLTVNGSVASGGKQITIQSATLAANQGQQVEFKDPNRFVTDKNSKIVPVVNDTLLVDRFVLAGTTLKRKMEVRYKRSRNKYRSQGTKDSLGAKDLNQQPFYEPTQELDFVRNLRDGRFTALLLPTQIPEIKRWQLFAHNSKTGLIDSFNVERSSDGLFNTRGTQFYTSSDPKHRKDVFERQPGPDPFDNTKQLIPIVSKEGYAELALEFDGTGDYVQVDLPGAWNGDHFTLELWVKASETQQSAGTSVFSTQSGSGSFQIDSDGRGNYRFMGTPASTTIGGIETNWQHLAITYDGSMVKTYLNGIFKNSCAQSTFSFSEYRFGINRGKNLPFKGQIDEVRIWNRTRSQTEISEDMHHRLVGNELGLLGYWRFDAGSGTTVYDQTDNANNGTINGDPQWVESDAPIGDHPGIRRTSFQFAGRTIASGLTALLYHQQETAAAGYSQEEKPIKRNARVMLATATGGPDPQGQTTSQKYVAALDFAVSREGKLAQVPDNIDLKKPLTGSLNQVIQKLQQLERQQSDLKANNISTEQQGLSAPVKQRAEDFGYAVAMDGNKAIIGTDNGNKAYIFQLQDGNWNLQATLTPPQGTTQKGFSSTVAISGNTVVVGHYRDYDEANKVYIYQLQNDGTWSRETLDRPADSTTTGFGRAVAIDNNTVIIGGVTEAFIYQIDSKSWTRLPAPEKDRYGYSNFGSAVAISGDKVVVCASYSHGRVYIYQLESGNWNRKATLQNPDNDGSFGSAVAISGEAVIVGNYSASSNKGKAYIYQLESGTWNKTATFQPNTVSSGDKFGYAVDISGNTAIVGAYFADYSGVNNPGEVYVFQLNNGSWTEQRILRISNPSTAYLGCAVALSDKTALVGAFIQSANGVSAAGQAYVYNVLSLIDIEAEIKRLKAIIANGLALPMHLLNTDPFGLTVAGGLLGFASTNNAPQLFNSATGKLALYFRDPHDKFSVAYYDTNTSKVQRQLHTQYDVVVGMISSELSGNGVTTLSLNSGSRLDVPSNSQLRVGEILLTTSGNPNKGDPAISINSQDFTQTIPQGTLVYWVGGKSGILTFVARSAEPEMDQASIQVESGTTAETCKVKITNPSTGINETWNEVPRNVTQFTAVFNGTAKKQQYVGTLAADWSGGSPLSLANIPKRRLQRGNTLLVNGIRLQVGTISGNPTTTVPITAIPSSPPTIVKGTSVYFIGDDYYNYRTQASTNRPTDSLEQGSLQFIVVADPAKGKVQNGNTAGGDTSLSCAWVTESPGNALSFDGTDDYVSLADASKLSQFDAEGDITLEAWVNPSAPGNTNVVGNTARVIVHKSGDSQYTLGLKTTSTSPERYTFYAGVGSLFKQSQLRLPYKNSSRPNDEQWAHLAAVYNQSYAVKFDGIDDYLSCNHNPALDISQDLTIEAFLKLEDLSQQRGIITKGKIQDGTDQQVPYSLYVNTAGKLVFAFEDKDGEFHSYESTTPLQASTFYRIAVTRKHELETKDTGTQQAPNVVVKQWTDIRFYIGTLSTDHYLINEAGYHKYTDSDAGSSNQTLEIGRTQKGSQQDWFKGEMSEVRIWNQAVAKENLGITIKGEEKGLISWWRFEENKGQTAYDSKSQNHAALIGATWLKNPDLIGSTFVLYYNGEPVATEDMATKPNGGIDQFTLGACQQNNSSLTDYFKGTMEEIRVWKVPRTQEQILDNLFTRLKGEKEDLIANYTFDIENPPEVEDYSLFGNHLTLGSGNSEPNSIISKAPISDDIAQVRSALAEVTTQFQDTIQSRPAIQEYSDMQYDSEANLMGIQKRCYAYIKNGEWHLLAGYKVGNLVTEWVAQVQADPQIIGYIEGAPPVPSENLTSTSLVLGEAEDYGGASSVELLEPETVNYIYSSSSESGFDTSMSMKAVAGMASDSEAGFGLMTSVEQTNVTVGFAGNMDSSTSQLQEFSVSYGRSTTKITRQELSGAWENKDNTAKSYINPAVGRRFIPNNVGLALVQSDTMDVFALRLKHNNALVSYRMLPNPDIPKDWNLIVFPLNPTYSKQGTLDGKVGVKEDGSVQCDPHYPNAATYGEWSYFKPKEAYALKKQIEREQQELETYYQQYATEQGTGAGTGAGIGAGVGAAVGAAVAGPIGMVIGAAAGGAIGGAAGGAATTSTDIPKDIAKRNLVNTYVWTAKGGFFSESTEVMESTSESSTGSYSFQGLGGVTSEFNTAIAKVAIGMEMDALFGGHTETIKTKDKETEKSFTLELEVNTDGDLQLYVNTDAEKQKYTKLNEGGGAYDAQGNPILRPGKVDAYRFMTFYLEPKPDNFDDFFGKVVDPIWLEQSGDSYAVALRQAKEKAQESQKKPECWRIMHRVTFVSRILPEVDASHAPPVESAIKAAYVESNWELIQKLKPFVENQTSDYVTFADTVRDTLQTYLPELLPHTTEIIKYAALYFGVEEEV